MSMENNSKAKRKIYIDFIRIIAIYMVLFHHTDTNGYLLYTVSRESIWYWAYLFNAVFINIAVPLFLMSTGALLINKEEPIKKILKNRFLKYAIVLVVSSAIVYIYNCLKTPSQEMSLLSFVKILYTSQHNTALWYLYMYLAYLLMLPFLRKMAQHMTNTEYVWMFCMFGVIYLLRIIDFMIWKGEATYNGQFTFFITIAYVFYPLMGYFIEYRLEEKDFSRRNLIILLILSFMAVSICTFASHYRSTLLDAWDRSNCEYFLPTLSFVPTIMVFYASKMFFMYHTISDRTKTFIATCGGTTFGVYLIENICRIETYSVFVFLKPIIHTLPACWLWIATACVLGMLITYLFKKIPIISKFI